MIVPSQQAVSAAIPKNTSPCTVTFENLKIVWLMCLAEKNLNNQVENVEDGDLSLCREGFLFLPCNN
jgi:hypothetical protein